MSSQEKDVHDMSDVKQNQLGGNTISLEEVERVSTQVRLCIAADSTARDKIIEQSGLLVDQDCLLRERRQAEKEHKHELELHRINSEAKHEKDRANSLESQLVELTAVFKKLESSLDRKDLTISQQRTELQQVRQEREMLQTKQDEKQRLILELQRKIEVHAQKAKMDERTFLKQVEEALEEAVEDIEREKLQAVEDLADTLHSHVDNEMDANQVVWLTSAYREVEVVADRMKKTSGDRLTSQDRISSVQDDCGSPTYGKLSKKRQCYDSCPPVVTFGHASYVGV